MRIFWKGDKLSVRFRRYFSFMGAFSFLFARREIILVTDAIILKRIFVFVHMGHVPDFHVCMERLIYLFIYFLIFFF